MKQEEVFVVGDALCRSGKFAQRRPDPEAVTRPVFVPGEADYRFNLSGNAGGIFFKGRLFLFWKSSPKDEDTMDSVVRYSFSEDDGEAWHESRILCPAGEDGFLRSYGSCYSDGKKLVVYIQKVTTYYGAGETFTEYYTSQDGEVFEGPYLLQEERPGQSDGPLEAAASGSVLRCRSGRLIMGFQGNIDRYGRRQFVTQMYYTDCADGIHGWKKAELPLLERPGQGQGVEIEPGYFQRPDGTVVAVFRDMQGGGTVLASVSYDEGEHYSMARRTNLPDSNSSQCGGVLPDGTVFLINNPEPKRRIPLALHLSRDGVTFTGTVILRAQEDLQEKRFEGLAKGEGYSYPGACVGKDRLYVFYATNKEDIEMTSISYGELKKYLDV